MNGPRDLLRSAAEPPAPGDIATRADVLHLVRAFYREAAVDNVLAPVFAAARVDWSAHVPTVTDFWCWQLLGERGYARHTLGAHRGANQLVPFTGVHYARWLAIWESTVDEHFTGPVAELAKHRARVVARAMRRHLGGDDASDGQAGNRQPSSTIPRT